MPEVNLSKTNVFPHKHLSGVQVSCMWSFDDGTPDGKRIRMYGYGKTEGEAKEKLKSHIRKKQEELSYGDALSKGETTIRRALRAFLEWEKTGKYISSKTGKPKTPIAVEHDYETAEALLFPCKELMSLQVNKVTPSHILKWKKWTDEKTYKKAGKKYYYSADKKNKAYRLLRETINPCFEGMGFNPIAGVSKWTVHTKKKSESDILTPDEIKLFLSYCLEDLTDHNRAQGAVNVLIYPRKGELLGLKAGDYNRSRATLTIQRTLIRHTDGSLELSEDGYGKNNRSLRDIVLDPYTCAVLDKITEGKKPNELLFTTPKGNLVNGRNYSEWFKRTLKKLGIHKDIPAYRMRASGISFAVNHGADREGVADNAGHSKRTADNYYIVSDATKARAAATVTGEAIRELMAVDTVGIELKNEV